MGIKIVTSERLGKVIVEKERERYRDKHPLHDLFSRQPGMSQHQCLDKLTTPDFNKAKK